MSGFIFMLTLRQLLLQKSTLLLALLALIPLLIALIFRLSESDQDPENWTAEVLLGGLVVTIVVPLTALLLGASVIGDELEDGTAVYLLTKPLPRWQVLLPKVAAALLLAVALAVPATVLSGLLAIEGGGGAIVTGFAVAVLLGSLAYVAVFVLLSLLSNHALIIGLIYIFLWEGALAGIFEGLRFLSIRHFSLGIAEWVAGTERETFDAYLGGETALAFVLATAFLALLWANRRLEQVEVREAS